MTISALTQELRELPERVLTSYVDGRAAEEPSAEALIILVAAFRDAIDDLGALKKRIVADIGREFAPEKTTFQVPELGPVKVGHKKIRTGWDKERLLPAALSRITDKPGVLCDEDGVTHPPAVIAQRIYDELYQVVGFGEPKKPGIKALGFDPDEYSKFRWEAEVSLPARQL